jgi:flagellar basal-body rod protein FlgC
MSDMIDTFNVAASGLAAERLRLQTIATNMANARTTRTAAGGPFQRQVPTFEAQQVDPFGDELDRATSRVVVTGIGSDGRPPVRVYDPTHPDADATGYVSYPDIDVMQEMVDLMTTNRAYEANSSVVEATRDMSLRALEIGR